MLEDPTTRHATMKYWAQRYFIVELLQQCGRVDDEQNNVVVSMRHEQNNVVVSVIPSALDR